MKARGLGKNKKGSLIEKLSRYVSDTAVLYVKTLNYHWNMRGPQFFMYHKLLEDQYEMLAKGMDELAERVRMLGGVAPGSLQDFLKLTSLPEGNSLFSEEEMVEDLVKSHELMSKFAHALIKFSDGQSDPGTSDLLIDRMREHDKNAWLLKSHFKN